eukprot:GHVU01197307.1.p2 GENE.GHVU01197307.1~~GHVU01197307.1.p2  ORF type:complete len:154 (+),score=8.71 GHVU01197307.1:688-1149(+)
MPSMVASRGGAAAESTGCCQRLLSPKSNPICTRTATCGGEVALVSSSANTLLRCYRTPPPKRTSRFIGALPVLRRPCMFFYRRVESEQPIRRCQLTDVEQPALSNHFRQEPRHSTLRSGVSGSGRTRRLCNTSQIGVSTVKDPTGGRLPEQME